jgi:hypothetical protein
MANRASPRAADAPRPVVTCQDGWEDFCAEDCLAGGLLGLGITGLERSEPFCRGWRLLVRANPSGEGWSLLVGGYLQGRSVLTQTGEFGDPRLADEWPCLTASA